jgi:hypothetical protein
MAGFLTEHLAVLTDDQLWFLADFSRASREVALRAAVEIRAAGDHHAVRRSRPAAE